MRADEACRLFDEAATVRELRAVAAKARIYSRSWTKRGRAYALDYYGECLRALRLQGAHDRAFYDWLHSLDRAWRRGRSIKQERYIHHKKYKRYPDDWETAEAIDHCRRWSILGNSEFADWMEEQSNAG